jgi:hypothetical protein
MRCAWMRALTSTPPPAANGTISVIGRVGQSCARAGPQSANAPAMAAAMNFLDTEELSCSNVSSLR